MDGNNYIVVADLGLKPIHLACLEGDFEVVLKLVSHSEDVLETLTEPEIGTEWGLRETPIKLAALMGHLDIVEFLIEKRVNLVSDGLYASSYTKEEGFAMRRREFFLKTAKIGREHLDAQNTRKTICELLSSHGRRSVLSAMKGPRADLGFPEYRVAKQGNQIVVYAPVHRIKTDISLDRSKTIGVITAKGNSEVLMAAHSGFKPGGDRDEKCLDTKRWNYIALHHIAALLKFQFPGNKHGNGNKPAQDEHRGRAHAGHVEVLLAAWYALEMTRQSSGNKDADQDWLLANMHMLKYATLGNARSAVIMIDSQPCGTCLKFINRMFQYTGIHFSVRGGIGIGPTLATKDERTGARYDTFGDTFPESDSEEPSAVEHMVQGLSPVAIPQATRQPPVWMPIGGQKAPPVFNSDGGIIIPATNPSMAMERAKPTTPHRPRMQWPIPIPEHRSRFFEDPFSDIPSRRPPNHFEILAEYKKKTPVYEFPGYETIQADRQPHQQEQLPKPLILSLQTRRPSAAVEEDTVLIDVEDDSDTITYSSTSSDNGTCLRRCLPNLDTGKKDENKSNPRPNETGFSYSSFEPLAACENKGIDEGENQRGQRRFDISSESSDDDDYFYIPRQMSQRPRPGNNDSPIKEQSEEREVAPHPVSGLAKLQQWRYQPQPRARRQILQPWRHEGQTVQPYIYPSGIGANPVNTGPKTAEEISKEERERTYGPAV
ncbi:uncharacterized protein F4812DRAFT_440257 [Daldinia caldariorum]|uniref:uncharacterized protein n=1 Tax=Daldinia caldariorum TaxID=326644 RepID=UPI0020083503|nr:uncharacterized protein F4812DRAFT_440257 [Daldinia caldariorum]KAI1465260.1 hypothetical protein F4812DRAFT_440257 [Daldinia caldariorum]